MELSSLTEEESNPGGKSLFFFFLSTLSYCGLLTIENFPISSGGSKGDEPRIGDWRR